MLKLTTSSRHEKPQCGVGEKNRNFDPKQLMPGVVRPLGLA